MKRNDICWVDLGPQAGRRPVCVLTRDPAIELLTSLTCAPITRTIRGILSEVEVGKGEGLSQRSVIACDGLITVPKSAFDSVPTGRLTPEKRMELDQALRYALDIVY